MEQNKQAFIWGRYFAHHNNADDFLGSDPNQQADNASDADDLQMVMTQSTRLLTDYQNKKYAARFLNGLSK